MDKDMSELLFPFLNIAGQLEYFCYLLMEFDL